MNLAGDKGEQENCEVKSHVFELVGFFLLEGHRPRSGFYSERQGYKIEFYPHGICDHPLVWRFIASQSSTKIYSLQCHLTYQIGMIEVDTWMHDDKMGVGLVEPARL